MSIRCDICGLWSPGTGFGHRDICLSCFALNFAGAQPPLEEYTPSAREALAAFVDSAGPYQLTPRQRAAMARLHARWRQEDEA